MIRRALPGEIQRDFHAEPFGFLPERDEVVDSAESGFDGRMSARVRSDSPGAAGIVLGGGQRVVGTFPEAGSNRMNGRQVHDVEPEIGDPRQLRARFGEGAASTRIRTGRSREHLVPGAEARALAIDPDAPGWRRRRARAVRVPCHQRRELAVHPARHALFDGRRLGERIGPFEQPVRVGLRRSDLFRACGRLANENRSFEQLQRHVLTRRRLHLHVAPPCEESIDPRDDRVLVPSRLADVEVRRPFVGARRAERHRRLAPLGAFRRDLGFGIRDLIGIRDV